ncbi:hypothetical protein PIB30_036546 [Stylosanthes scabra]|uniref:Uncharacterized protein n=1 Tax=Stylosanthes scabra TaxID=79078 RepID=A0ABU6UDY0_9FABA|nr:hypothetical protein [Stylosanthes scabra]
MSPLCVVPLPSSNSTSDVQKRPLPSPVMTERERRGRSEIREREREGKRKWWRERKRKGNRARVFNQGLVNHVLSNKGTLLRPNSPPMDIYIFSLLDEGAKSILSRSFERYWGIFYFDGKAKYPLNLGLGNKELKNAKNVEYLPSR